MNCYNMRKILLALIVLGALASCEENKESVRQLHAYFNLDSLLEQQVFVLYDRGAEVQKVVRMDGEEEVRTFVPDTSQWRDEFAIIKDFNINKPYYVGSFNEVKKAGKVIFQPNSEDLAVTQFELTYSEDELIRIESFLDEEKYIYTNKRKLTMEFAEGLLKSYQIDGSQKMILQDEVDYVISGSISVQ